MNTKLPRPVKSSDIADTVARLCIDANCMVSSENIAAMEAAREAEESPVARNVLGRILRNHALAVEHMMPACQDTGVTVVFVEMGQGVQVVGDSLEDAVNEGVSRGYTEGYLRKSVVSDPLFQRANTGDNTPAIIHLRMVPGDAFNITVAPKGGGAENMSALKMLYPAAGVEGVRDFVLDTVRKAGPNACPPMTVGVGVGGNFETCAFLAKKALMRPLGSYNDDSQYEALEEELLSMVNAMGIGPQGFGGNTTALAVHIEWLPCHIASLPVAVNINCHVSPHKSASL